VFILVWTLFGAVSAFGAVGANIVAYATILGHVPTPLAFVASADRYVVSDFARVPGDEHFAPEQFFSYLGWCFYYPVRLLMVFATRPKAELDICDITFGESLLVLLLHAYQHRLLGNIPRDVIHHHPRIFTLRCACFQVGFV
jgi:hypothetical protein